MYENILKKLSMLIFFSGPLPATLQMASLLNFFIKNSAVYLIGYPKD